MNEKTSTGIGCLLAAMMVFVHGGPAARGAGKPDPAVPLTAAGEKLEARYAAALSSLRAEMAGALAAFLDDPRNQSRLVAAAQGEKPERPSPFLQDALDEMADYFRAAIIPRARRDPGASAISGRSALPGWRTGSRPTSTRGGQAGRAGRPLSVNGTTRRRSRTERSAAVSRRGRRARRMCS